MDALSCTFVGVETILLVIKFADSWLGHLNGARARPCQKLQMTGTYRSTVLPVDASAEPGCGRAQARGILKVLLYLNYALGQCFIMTPHT